MRDYPRALALLRVSEVTLYMVTAIVIHVLVGNDVASPSLNSVSPIFKKISYGIAIQTVGGPSKGVLLCRPADRISQIVIAGAVNAHVAMKSIYLRMFHSRNAMHSRPLGAISLWAVVCVTLWFLAWVVSESTPVFNDILGLAVSSRDIWGNKEGRGTPLGAETDDTCPAELIPCQLVYFQSSRRVLALPQCTWEASKLEADNSDRLQLHHCHHRGSYGKLNLQLPLAYRLTGVQCIFGGILIYQIN